MMLYSYYVAMLYIVYDLEHRIICYVIIIYVHVIYST